MATQQQRLFKAGNATIRVCNDEFEDGYACGSLAGALLEADHESAVTVQQLRELILSALSNREYSSERNTGYIVGAIESFCRGHLCAPDPEAPEVQLGAFPFNLNNWRFREGFSLGIKDYHYEQVGSGASAPLSANALLNYVATCDPETGRYCLNAGEENCLEEVFGRMLGYLGAALFSLPVASAG